MSTTYSSGSREENRSGRGNGFRPFARRRTAPPTSGSNSGHCPQQGSQHGGNQPPSKEHFNWRSGGFSPPFLGFFILKTLQKHLPKNVFYNMILSLFLPKQKQSEDAVWSFRASCKRWRSRWTSFWRKQWSSLLADPRNLLILLQTTTFVLFWKTNEASKSCSLKQK